MCTSKTIRKPFSSATQTDLNSLSTNATFLPSLENVGNAPDNLNSPTSGTGDSILRNCLSIFSPGWNSDVTTIIISYETKGSS